MARIRTVKPEFFSSLTVASLPLTARLTFIGLWTHCDDDGRCVDDARLIRAALWPLDDRSIDDVEQDVCVLSEAALIVRYKVGGRRFLAVKGWQKHQKINRPRASELPPPPDPPMPPLTSQNEPSVEAHGAFTASSLPERKGKERKGKEEQQGADAPAVDLWSPNGFPTRHTHGSTMAEAITAYATEHDLQLPSPRQRSDVYRCLVDLAADKLGTTHPAWRRVAQRLCVEYVADAVGADVKPSAQGHVARLVSEFGAHGALRGLTTAVASGAGLDDAHAGDARALTKYAHAVCSGEAASA